ncbi:hypothetical protein RHMOL_Rhmol06G0280100 [Rhododendron molle]|uniref:Uncharacterized protein n=1 Tax=Rhododendron molle TaxID=49168 RepID=A0ACC0NHD1_RHOML|nr:hypothetical protein RHMOL_Rhmol06G0280100 [Rhododendron molle]
MTYHLQCRGGTGQLVVSSTHLGRSNVFWTAQICLGLRGCFGNFTLKNYPNRFEPSKIRLDGRGGARHLLSHAHPALKNFSFLLESLLGGCYASSSSTPRLIANLKNKFDPMNLHSIEARESKTRFFHLPISLEPTTFAKKK